MSALLPHIICFCCLLFLGLTPARAEEPVTVGYQLIYNTWKTAMASGEFAEATGRDIQFRRFDSPGKLLPALASGDVDIGLLGSTGVATAMSTGLPVELFWIAEAIEDAEALAVRDGSGVVAPQDLRGRTIAVPFVSTTHFHLLFAMEQFNIPASEVKLLNMAPNAVAAAWERGDVDAAFVWDPALSRILESGKVLVSSGQLGDWGKPTFDGLVARTGFSRAHPEFMKAFVRVLARADARYRDDPQSFTPDSEPVRQIVSLVGGDPAQVPNVLSRYGFPSLQEQVSCHWLGCGDKGGAARALKATAAFLKEQNKIPKLLDSYAPMINPHWAEAAMHRQ